MKTIRLQKLLLILALATLPTFLTGQSLKELTDAYNAGAKFYQEKKAKEALEQLYLALDMSEDLGEEGTEIKRNCEDLIPSTHIMLAQSLYKAQDYYGTIDQLEKAKASAQKINERKIIAQVQRMIPQLYNQMGNTNFRSDNFDKAIEYYQKAIAEKENYPDPYLGISLAYEKMEKYDLMLESLKKTMEVSLKENDRNKADDAQKKAKAYLLRTGDEAQKAKDYNQAIEKFTKAIEFDSIDGAIYFVLAVNYSELKNWEKVIENSKLALDYGNGSIDQAGVYYQIGVAHQNLGNNTEACEAFSKALNGSFRAAAEYQMKEVLKCQ